TVHLKIKYHSLDNQVITIHADIEGTRRYFRAVMRALYTAQEFGAMSSHTPEPNDDADFDASSDNSVSDEEKTSVDPLPLETMMKFKRLIPDGEFITIQLDDNQTKTVKI
ncbi:hypothetical protein A2U01_0000895, partial [Trifolium medium]|nr:hypothetical protein [Trifolium medium]